MKRPPAFHPYLTISSPCPTVRAICLLVIDDSLRLASSAFAAVCAHARPGQAMPPSPPIMARLPPTGDGSGMSGRRATGFPIGERFSILAQIVRYLKSSSNVNTPKASERNFRCAPFPIADGRLKLPKDRSQRELTRMTSIDFSESGITEEI